MAVGITKVQYFLVIELPSPLQDLKVETRYPQAPFPLNFRQLGGSSQVLSSPGAEKKEITRVFPPDLPVSADGDPVPTLWEECK